jgi:hypothetical protein
MIHRTSRFIGVASVAVALLILTGCAGKIASNFANVKPGMSPKQVDDLLGTPKDTAEIDMGAMVKGLTKDMPPIPGMDIGAAFGKISARYWEESDKAYVVHFQNDKVTQTYSGTKDEMAKKKKG